MTELSLTYRHVDEAALKKIAALLASLRHCGDIIALYGSLGVGKTVFARAYIQSLCPGEDVPSPTFTLAQQYEPDDDCLITHMDAYRLEDPEEVYELGFEDALVDGVCLIEWPEKIGACLPQEHLAVHLSMEEDHSLRRIRIEPFGRFRDRMPALEARLEGIQHD